MTTKNPLFNLTRSTLRKRLLGHFFENPKATHYLREIALLLRVDPANLSRDLRGLVKEGVFAATYRGNQKHFFLNRNYPLFEELRSMVLKTLGSTGAVRDRCREAPVSWGVKNKNVYIIAGPNGSGKTTFARTFLPDYAKSPNFVNADLIAQGLAPFGPRAAAVKAGKIVLQQIREYAELGVDFSFETTLSGKSYAGFLSEVKARGYFLNLFFLWLPSPELAIKRIKDRVQEGGHDVPAEDVRRRFARGIHNFFSLYEPLLDFWMMFDNSGAKPLLIAKRRNGCREVVDEALFKLVQGTASHP